VSGFVDGLKLWAAQDVLLAGLEASEALTDVAKGLGHPANIEPQHVWIGGAATGSVTTELSGDAGLSDETFKLKLFVFAQADDYAATRELLKSLAGAAVAVLASSAFAAVVHSWTIPDYALDDGTDGTHTQLALELTVECRCW
jgi:hypothetical protein